MNDMKVIDLSEAQQSVQDSLGPMEAELQEYDLGEIVHVDGRGDGIIAAFVTEEFSWPGQMSEEDAKELDVVKEVNDDESEIVMEGAEDNPVYIVALEEGGSVPATAEEISTEDASIGGDGEEIESWEEVRKAAGDAELAEVYDIVDDPYSYEELQSAKKKLIMEGQAATLADYVEEREVSLKELDSYSVTELQNIPGVDDPHVGFGSMPNGWHRDSVLQAWASLGGMWRTCYARMIREFGPNFAKRWCAALKDEVLMTEEWRGDF